MSANPFVNQHGDLDVVALLAQIRLWVEEWQPRLHIPEYKVVVEQALYEDSSESYMAEAHIQPEYLAACIDVRISDPGWIVSSLEELEQTVIHELAHIVNVRTRHLAYDLLHDNPDVWKRYDMYDEEAVERIARLTWQAWHGRDQCSQALQESYPDWDIRSLTNKKVDNGAYTPAG